MDIRDELQELRRQLDEIVRKTSFLSLRLTQLQNQIETREHLHVDTAAPPEPPAPPPRPPVEPPKYKPPHPDELVSQEAPAAEPASRGEEPRVPPVPGLLETIPENAAVKFIRERWDELQAKRKELGWEVLVGTYGLPRIAIVCITIAVVFFLSLAIERWGSQWMPHLRVAVGYGICAGLLVLAWRFEKKYGGLARVLYGGGFAVMYFVSFATHYVKFAQIFQSAAPTLVLLTVVVVGWAVAAQLRRSKVIAVLVTALGHFTLLVSTLTLAAPGLFSILGLAFLSAGSAFFLLRNRWYYVASLGLVGCYINDALILAHGRGTNPQVDFWVSMGVLSFFFLTFALAELLSHEELRRDLVPAWFRNGLVTLNSACFLVIGTALVAHFEFTRGHQDVFRLATAAALLLIALGYLRLRAGDPLFNVYFVKATALLTLALATRYGGSTLGAWLAIETVVLLYSARRSGLVVTRLLAFAVGVIALLCAAPVALSTRVDYDHENYNAWLLVAGLQVLAFLAASQLYQRTNWKKRSPGTAYLLPRFAKFWWRLDLIKEPPEGAERLKKPAGGLLFPYLYAVAGALLFYCHTWSLAEFGHRLPVLAGFALLATVAAYGLASKPFGCVSVMTAVAVAFPVVALEVLSRDPFYPYVAAGGLAALAVVALASEGARLGLRRGLDYHQYRVSPYVLYGEVALLTAVALAVHLSPFNCTLAMAGAAAAAGALVFVLHPLAWGAIGLGFLAWASVWCMGNLGAPIELKWRFACWGLAALLVAADRYFIEFRSRIRFGKIAAAISTVLCMAVLWRYLSVEGPPEWFVASMALTCFAFCAYGLALRSDAAYVVALLAGAGVTVFHIAVTAWDVVPGSGLVTGFVLLALFWIAVDRISAYRAPKAEHQMHNAVAVGAVLLCMAVVWACLRFVAPPAWLAACMTLSCFAFCAYGLGLRSRAAFATGAVIVLIISAFHIKHAFEVEVLDKGMVAGFVLLALFWVALERVLAFYGKKHGDRIQNALAALNLNAKLSQIALVPVLLMTGVLLVLAYRAPQLLAANRGFITIGWFGIVAGNFVLSLAFRQREFRYAGLGVIVLSLLRLFLVDMSEQDPLLRVAAFAVVGAVLLSISVGYYKWMAKVKAQKSEKHPELEQ